MRGGDYVLMARRRAGFTQRELADRLGLRQATIARWERGDRQVGFEDVEAVAAACGLQLDAHLVVEDRSWWSQIALQLELDPIDRVRRLTPSDSPDLAAGLNELVVSAQPVVVIGEVAGALQGSPLILSGEMIELCARVGERSCVEGADQGPGRHEYELPGGAPVRAVESPPGTRGFHDLCRDSEAVETRDGELRVASVLDLLRIADASPDRGARLEALAYQAVLDVRRAETKAPAPGEPTSTERIEAWLKQQTPIAS